MDRGRIGQIATPAAGNRVEAGRTWCADNSVFAGKYPGDEAFLGWLKARRQFAESCRFVVAPDVVCDAAATLERSRPMFPRIRALGFPVALVAQNGLESMPVPWDEFDALFLGGDDKWKLGPEAAALVTEAKSRGKWVHMGRVNSRKRLAYAAEIGCDSADGTYIAFGPDKNLPRMLRWIHEVNAMTAQRHCAGCGYLEAYHDLGTRRCPIETANAAGARGKFRLPADEPRKEWFGLSVPLSPAELAEMKALADAAGSASVATGPPQVVARPPQGPGEFAGGDGAKQGTKLGRHAVALGWTVKALYWRSFDGTEGCGVWLSKDELRAVATWKRPAGNVGKLTGWASDFAYAWRADVERFPTRMNLTDLEGLIQ